MKTQKDKKRSGRVPKTEDDSISCDAQQPKSTFIVSLLLHFSPLQTHSIIMVIILLHKKFAIAPPPKKKPIVPRERVTFVESKCRVFGQQAALAPF